MEKAIINQKEAQNGITLIALVITIIVLLILAGVSIAMLTGQNGILTQANNAKNETELASAKEKVELAVIGAISQTRDGTLTVGKLRTELANYGGTVEGDTFPVTAKVDGKSFTVDANGNVELAWSKPQMTEAKIVASANGEGTDVPDDQAEGTELYISFKASLENGTITSVTCDKGTVENKNGLYVMKITQNGTYTFTITGTGEAGSVTSTIPVKVSKYETSTLNAAEIAAKTDKTKIYGATVTGYTLPSGTTTDVKWKIFYADNSNIYLIADNYVERTNLPNSTDGKKATANKPNDGSTSCARAAYFSNILEDYKDGSSRITENKLKALNNDYFNTKGYTSTNSNMKSVAYMMDTTAWNSKFRDTGKAEYVIGGPTVELLFKSYNEKYKLNNQYQAQASNNTGYQISWDSGATWKSYTDTSSAYLKTDPLYVITKQTDAYAYWLASPSAYSAYYVMGVYYDGDVDYSNNYTSGFRPLVCLKSDVTLEKVSDTEYAIQ